MRTLTGVLADHKRAQRFKAERMAEQLAQVNVDLQSSVAMLRRSDRSFSDRASRTLGETVDTQPRVLIVDDDASQPRLIEFWLQEEGDLRKRSRHCSSTNV